MSKGILLIHNKDERATARQDLTGFTYLGMHNNLREGLDDIKRNKGNLDLLILDERFDQSMEAKNVDLKVLDLLEEFNNSPERPMNAVVVIILNESSTLESPVRYTESGVDLLVRRPFGASDLRAKIVEAIGWISTPPPIVKLMRNFQALIKAGKHNEVAATVGPLFDKNPLNIRLGLLYTKALILEKGDSRKKGVEIARSFDNRFPDSLFAKRLMIEAYQLDGLPQEAFRIALQLHHCLPTEETFNQCFAMADEINQKAPENFAPWMALLLGVQLQEAPRTKERRLNILKHLTAKDPGIETVEKLITHLSAGQEDILPQCKEFLDAWLKKVQVTLAQLNPPSEALENLLGSGLKIILDLEPGFPDAIGPFVDLHIKRKTYDVAEKYLATARDKGKVSVSFFSSFVKLSLEQDMLKEASDMIHAGRRLAPSDERWDAYSKLWTEKYNRKQNTAK